LSPDAQAVKLIEQADDKNLWLCAAPPRRGHAGRRKNLPEVPLMEMGMLPKRASGLGLGALVTVCAIIALGIPPGVFAADRVVLCEEFTNFA